MHWTDRAGRRISLRHLHILLAVIQSGSIAKAASALSISHPVVSKTISDLEHVLKVRLLDRGPQGVEPTIHGRACFDCGLAVFGELRRGIQHIQALTDPTVGEVKVGAAEPMMQEFIPSIVERLARKHPQILFNLTVGDAAVLHAKLHAREVDLIVSRRRLFPSGEEFGSELFFDESLVVVCGRENPWAARRKKFGVAELIDEAWVMPDSDNIIAPLIVAAFGSLGLPAPRAKIVSNSLSVRSKMAANGHFLTILPGSIFYGRKERQALKILPVLLPIETQPVEIITLKNRTPTPVVALFIESLRAEGKLLARAARGS
jgi:DNA-binding transcriptional LysR family regulator